MATSAEQHVPFSRIRAERICQLNSEFGIFRDGAFIPFRTGGKAICQFNPGWSPHRLYICSESLLLSELHHVDGASAMWILDNELNLIAISIATLSAEKQSHLKEIILNIIVCGIKSILQEPDFTSYDDVSSFLKFMDAIGWPTVRADLASIPSLQIVPRSRVIELDNFSDSEIPLNHNGASYFLPRDKVQLPFRVRSMQAVAPEIVKSGVLQCPSPLNGTLLTCEGAIMITGLTIAYRFFEPDLKQVFFLIASQLEVRFIAIYFPAAGLCITPTQHATKFLADQQPGLPIERPLVSTIIDHLGEIISYFDGQRKEIILTYHHNHLGHHLWQELTGVNGLIEHLNGANLPRLFVFDPRNSEMYGRYEDIFPELAGQVDRSCENLRALKSHIYRNHLCPIVPTMSYVAAGLRRRICSYAESSPACAIDRDTLTDIRARKEVVVLFGLRVENRTLIDLEYFITRLIEHFQALDCRVTLVIDGHNGRDGQTGEHVFSSHREWEAHERPIDVERRIVSNLQARFRESSIRIIDLIGAPVQRSVFWAVNCAFFIAPWGAGLAKYRWVANQHGLILAGHHYITRVYDLHIYSSGHYMEEPSPVLFNGVECVEDAVGSDSLVQISEPARVSYRVSFDAIAPLIDQLLVASGVDVSGRQCQINRYIAASEVIPVFQSSGRKGLQFGLDLTSKPIAELRRRWGHDLQDGQVVPLRMRPDWLPEAVYTGFHPILILIVKSTASADRIGLYCDLDGLLYGADATALSTNDLGNIKKIAHSILQPELANPRMRRTRESAELMDLPHQVLNEIAPMSEILRHRERPSILIHDDGREFENPRSPSAPGPWEQQGPRAWIHEAGLALVYLDRSLPRPAWRGALRRSAARLVDPDFIMDDFGRIHEFDTADAARIACEARLTERLAR